MKEMQLRLITGVSSIGIGLLYMFHAFGPTEAEVVTWGKAASLAGIVLITLALAAQRTPQPLITLGLLASLMLITLLQILPIYLWFAFHGSGISDSSPPSTFTAHQLFALPHTFLLILGLTSLVQLSPRHLFISKPQQTVKPVSKEFHNESGA